MKVVIGSVLAAVLSAPLAFAQAPPATQPAPGTWNGLSDRFRIDAGYFGLTAQTTLKFNGGDVDFEKDLGVSKNVNTFWIDGIWRVGRRHQVELAFTRTHRDRADFTLGRDFIWGGQTYNAGLGDGVFNVAKLDVQQESSGPRTPSIQVNFASFGQAFCNGALYTFLIFVVWGIVVGVRGIARWTLGQWLSSGHKAKLGSIGAPQDNQPGLPETCGEMAVDRRHITGLCQCAITSVVRVSG